MPNQLIPIKIIRKLKQRTVIKNTRIGTVIDPIKVSLDQRDLRAKRSAIFIGRSWPCHASRTVALLLDDLIDEDCNIGIEKKGQEVRDICPKMLRSHPWSLPRYRRPFQ